MAGRIKGITSFSGNFEPQAAAPLDARTRCETKDDLILQSTREANDNGVYAHPGMIVAVYNDPNPDNNGLYVLLDYDYTDWNNWKFIGASKDSKEYKDFIIRRGQETGAELLDDNIYTLQLNKYDSSAPSVTYYKNDWSTYDSTTTGRIHGRIHSNGYVFGGTRSLPARLVRIPVDKPEDWDQITLPDDDEHGFLEDFAIDKRTGKIYGVTSDVSYSHQTWIIEINPKAQTLSYVDWLKLDMNGSSSGFPTIFCKDGYLYVGVGSQDSKLYKIEIDTKTIVGNVQIGSGYNARIHNINSDGEYLFVTCTTNNAKIVRLDFDLNILEERTFSNVGFTDEFVIRGDYLFVGVDTANYGHSINVGDTLRRVNKLDFNDVYTYHIDDTLNNVPIYEVRFVDKYVVAAYDTSPSRLFFINPETNEVFEKQINVDYINSITTDGYYTLMSNRVEGTGTFVRAGNLKKTKVLDEYVDDKIANVQVDNGLHNDSGTIKLGGNLIEDTTISSVDDKLIISTTQNTDDSTDPGYAKGGLHLENTYNGDSYQRGGKIWNTGLMYDYDAGPYDDYVIGFSMVQDSDVSSVPKFNPNNDSNYQVDGEGMSLFLTRFFFQVYNNRGGTFRYRAYIDAHDIIFETNDNKLSPDEIKPSSPIYPTKYIRIYNNKARFEQDTNHIPNVRYVQEKLKEAADLEKTDEITLTSDVTAGNVVMTLSNTPLLNNKIKVYVRGIRQKQADFSVDVTTGKVTTNIDLQKDDNIIVDYYAE